MDTRQRFIFGLVFIGCAILFWVLGIVRYVSIETIAEHAAMLQAFVTRHYLGSILMYGGIFITTAVCALPAATLLTLTAGFFFGTIPGFIYTIIAAAIGATASFFLMRYLLADYVQHHYQQHLRRFNQAVRKQGYRYLFMIRLVPVMPFFLANIVASCLPISWRVFIITTTFGIMPITAVYAYAGKQLCTIRSVYDIFSFPILSALGLIALIGVIPVAVSWYKSRDTH